MAARAFKPIPLTNPQNTRIATVSGLPAASGVVGIGVVGTMIVGNSTQTTDKDARLINCFPFTVSDPMTGERRIYTVKRPGFAASTTPQSGSIGNALMVWSSQGAGTKVISAFGATNSSIYDGTSQLTTDNADTTVITGLATGITQTVVSDTATLVISSSDDTAWFYQNGGTVTKITDTDFPGNASKTLAGTFVHIAGFACIMDTNGDIWASDLNSVTSWTANSYGKTNAYPDLGIGLIRRGEEIMAFGTGSVEFWRNAGLTPFPLARIPGKTIKVGAVAADAIGRIADTIFWAGALPEGGISVFQYEGQVARISTAEIDAILQLAGASNISLTTARFYGRSFVIVTASSSTFVYVVEEKAWHEWSSLTNLWYQCVGTTIGSSLVTYAISNVGTSGKVYVINPNSFVFQDDSHSYLATVQTPPIDFATNDRKFWAEIELVGDQVSGSTVTVSYSDDDYQNFTVFGQTFDMSSARPRLFRLGSSSRRVYRFTQSDNTPMRLESLKGRVEMGMS